MSVDLVLASAYASGQLFGKLLAVVFVAALILHFWKSGPSKSDLAPQAQPPLERPLSTYGQPAPPPTPPPPPSAAQQARGGRPSWATPVVWGIAAIAGVAIIASHKDPEKFSDADKKEAVRGCTATAQNQPACQCLIDELVAKGYDTKSEMVTMTNHIRDAATSNSPQSLPPDFVAAVQTCRSRQ
jgi:hypothetical protein